jgi:ABC-type bacteriocin/lantibiotic exporter with double-glycine peptidase domain
MWFALTKWVRYRHLPWVAAVEARDCGAAAFASVARHHGHHLTLEQARQLVGTDRNGTTLAGLRDGGRAIGLESRPAQGTYEALGQLSLPAIVHLRTGEAHYLVLYRWAADHVVVVDSNRGVLRIDRADFEAEWSGYLVTYAPTGELRSRPPDFRPATLLLDIARSHRAGLAAIVMAVLLATSLGWLVSFFLQVLIDRILPGRMTSLLVVLGAGLVLSSGLQALIQFGRLWLAALIGERIQQRSGTEYLRHLMRLPLHVLDTRCVPGLVLRVIQSDQIQLSVTESSVALVADLVMFVGALIILAVYDPLVALIAGSAVPLVLLVTILMNDRVYLTQFGWMVRMEQFTAGMIDTFDAVRSIKVFGAERRYQRQLEARLEELTGARRDNRVARALPAAWSWLASSIIVVAVLWYGSTRVLDGQITAGQLLVIFGMVTFYLVPVQRFPDTVLSIRAGLIGLERLEEIKAVAPESTRTVDPLPLRSAAGRIEFDRVDFSYARRKPVLQQVSFTVEAGETVAIVGETGSGKTTIANLIAGFYLPTGGHVRIDGISTRQLDPSDLRAHISAVFQDPRLLQQSVRDNISLMADVAPETVRRAAMLANADEFISRLTGQYEAQVARFGDNFSSGQVQRIALARALLKDAAILLLDEATSNLDGRTERGILQALEENRRGRTTVVIGHRLSTVIKADRILVMHGGQLVESGTHEQLWAARGRYFDLFRSHRDGEPGSSMGREWPSPATEPAARSGL